MLNPIKKLWLVVLVLLFVNNSQLNAGLITIAQWTFETSVPTNAGPHVAEGGLQAGVAAATGFHTSAAAVYSNPAGNGSPESFSSNTWTTIGDYYQFQFNLTGNQGASITWDQARSTSGPGEFDLQYSTDGLTFQSILSYQVLVSTNPTPGAWNSTTYLPAFTIGPVSLPAAVNDQATVFVRMSSMVVAAAAGTNRIDNVRVQASAIPEPSAISLLAMAFLGGSCVRRRQ